MIELLNDLAGHWFSGWISILVYWLPLMICVITYIKRCWTDYQHDVKEVQKYRAKVEAYNNPDPEVPDNQRPPKPRGYIDIRLRIGTIIGRILASVIPVLNLFAAIFNAAPELLESVFDWLGRVFERPIVKVPKDTKPV